MYLSAPFYANCAHTNYSSVSLPGNRLRSDRRIPSIIRVTSLLPGHSKASSAAGSGYPKIGGWYEELEAGQRVNLSLQPISLPRSLPSDDPLVPSSAWSIELVCRRVLAFLIEMSGGGAVGLCRMMSVTAHLARCLDIQRSQEVARGLKISSPSLSRAVRVPPSQENLERRLGMSDGFIL